MIEEVMTDSCLFRDQKLKDLDYLIQLVSQENDRQLKKWGVQIHPSFEWVTYITEELGSLAKAVSEWEYRGGTPRKVRDEAIQVATLALKLAEMFNLLRGCYVGKGTK